MSRSKKIVLSILTAFMAVLMSMGIMFSMNGTKSVNAGEIPTEIGSTEFYVVEGAQMRMSDPYGIRFIGVIGSDKYDSLVDGDSIVSGKRLGMYIVPDSYYADYEVYKTENSYKGTCYEYFRDVKQNIIDFTYTPDQIHEQGNGYIIKAANVNILFNNMNLDFVGAMYVETTDGDNVSYDIVYSREAKRSVAYVAAAAHEAGETNEYVELANKLAAYNKLGVTYNAETGKYVYGGNDFDTLDAVGVNPETAYSLNVTSQSIIHDASFNLVVNGADKVKVAYRSSDVSVATVNENGVVTGVSAGSATITATVGIYEYTCNVTVTHENATSLGYGVYKIDNCSCGENGYFTTNKLNADGSFYNSDFEKGLDGWGVPPVKTNAWIKVASAGETQMANPTNNANGKFLAFEADQSVETGNVNFGDYLSNAVAVNPGDVMELSYRYCSTSSYQRPYVHIYCWKINDAGKLAYAGSTYSQPAPWHIWTNLVKWADNGDTTSATISYTVPADAQFCTVMISAAVAGKNGGVCHYFDDFKLKQYSINETAVTLGHGETTQLAVSGVDSASVVWATDSDVVTVENGLVTASANKAGVANVTATIGNVVITCVVNVEHDEDATITALTYIDQDVTMDVGISKVECSCGSIDYVATNVLNADGTFYNSDFEQGELNELPIGWSRYPYYTNNLTGVVKTFNDEVNPYPGGPKNGTHKIYSTGKYLALVGDENWLIAGAISNAFVVSAGDTLSVSYKYSSCDNYSDSNVFLAWFKIDENGALVKVSESDKVLANKHNCWCEGCNPVLTVTVPEDAMFASVVARQVGGNTTHAYFDNFKVAVTPAQ